MDIIEKQIVKHYHSSRLQQKDISRAKAQGWTSEMAQKARFDTILNLVDFEGTSVLDLGCGYGDFKDRLDAKYQQFDYIGIDQQPEFIAYAQEKYNGQKNTWFYEVDFSKCQLPQVDFVIACGVLSYYSKDTSYYMDMVQRFYEAAGRALIFNMLDKNTFTSGALLIAHDKNHIYTQCKAICSNTRLITGYIENDFTIKMEREKPRFIKNGMKEIIVAIH